MNTAAIVTLLLQAITELTPQLQQDFQKGTVTVAQQQALKDQIDKLPNDFSGPEWQQTP